MLVWGYKEDGQACLFDLSDGEQLPPEWSSDHMTIEDESKRTAEAITAAAGTSVTVPVKLENHVPHKAAPDPIPPVAAPKKRLGWPKGKPRGPRIPKTEAA